MALLLRREDAPLEESHALAPAEHGAYSELRVRERPLWGPVEQLAAIPGYTAAKAIGLMRDERTSPPSLDEMAEAYRGVGRGMKANIDALRRAYVR